MDIRQISTTFITVLSIGFLVFSSSFHIGYFNAIGIEFITLLSVVDVLTFIGYSFTVLLLCFTPLLAVAKFSMDFVNWRRNDILFKEKIPIMIKIGALVTLLASSMSVFILIQSTDILSSGSLRQLLALIMGSIFGMSATIFCGIRYVYNKEAKFGYSDAFLLTVLAFLWCVIFWLGGSVYAVEFAGRACLIDKKSGGHIEGRYLRWAGNGHLISVTGKTIFISGSEVKQISCNNKRMKI